MIADIDLERVRVALPWLTDAEPAFVRDLRDGASITTIPAGRQVLAQGSRVASTAVLLSGRVRVYLIGQTGREITLYRFGHGESCILSANAILGDQPFPALAAVEETAEAVMIPAALFRAWTDRHAPWRGFVFQLLSNRLTEVMTLVDQVVFRRLDARLAAYLLARANTGHRVAVTHQEIAAELGSSREVISRVLESLAGRGLLRSGRGEIELTDLEGLRECAG